MAISPHAHISQNVLQADILLLQQIQSLLLTEQHHLELGEAWALPELTFQKQKLTEELNRYYAEREPILRQAGLPLTMSGMREWIKQQANVDITEFERHWNQYLALAREIKSLNHMNGRLIELHLQQIENRLQTLTKAIHNESTYGANGLPNRIPASRAHTIA